jgi:hypothetical protein
MLATRRVGDALGHSVMSAYVSAADFAESINLGQLLTDIVAKVFLGGRTKLFRAADAFYERRREGPYRFIQNRPGISVVALKSYTAAEKSKDQLSRDFSGRSIFDFCNNIDPQETLAGSKSRNAR